MNELKLFSKVNGDAGYALNIVLPANELEIIREIIRIQWLYRIQLLAPEHVRKFDQLGMQHYHEASHLLDHAQAWAKNTRVFPREAVKIIRRMSFFKQLENELGAIEIADEENLGWENIYWRLVRPGNADFGSIHADKWFWDIGGYGQAAHFPYQRMKIWVPIYATPGLNGLMIVPKSHLKKDWRWHIEEKLGRKKPILDEELNDSDLLLLPLNPGESVVFNDELLHGGAPNRACTTRVSLEFTILIPVSSPASSNCVPQKEHELI